MNVVVHAYEGEPGPLEVEAEPDADGLTVDRPRLRRRDPAPARRRTVQPAARALADRRPLQQLLDLGRARPRHRGRDAPAAARRRRDATEGAPAPVETAGRRDRDRRSAAPSCSAPVLAASSAPSPPAATSPSTASPTRCCSPTRSPPRAPGRFADGQRPARHRRGRRGPRAAARADGGRRRRARSAREPRRARRRRLAGGAGRRGRGRGSPSDGEYLRRSASAAPAPAPLTCSRIRSRARRRMRETCICEWPICSAICDWVMSSTKRRRRTSRSRSSRWGRRRVEGELALDQLEALVLVADPLGGRRFLGVLAADRPVERERAAVVVGLQHLEHVGRLELRAARRSRRPRASAAAPRSAPRSLCRLRPCGRAGRAAPARSRPGRGSGASARRGWSARRRR